MIVAKYRPGFIELVPETMDDNQALINIFKNSHIHYNSGTWDVNEKDIDWINQCLLPVKHLLSIDDSFKRWRSGVETTGITIRCGVVSSYIKKGSFELPTKEIEEATRYFWKPAVNHPKFKAGKWDGYINLYKRWETSFPTGLLHEIEAVLTQKGLPYKVEYLYNRELPKQFNWEIRDGIVPDPDQIEAVEKCIKGKRGICKAPTGQPRPLFIAI